jgi:hypothetical protein
MKRTELKRKTELRRKSAPRRSQPKRDWTAARAKVEHAACRLCAPDENCGPVEAAHVIGRECDRPNACGQCRGAGLISNGTTFDGSDPYALGPCSRCHGSGVTTTLYVHPDSVIPLGSGHHKLYDAHSVDVLPVLTLEEQVRAVEDAGGIELARQRTCPSQYPRTERVGE